MKILKEGDGEPTVIQLDPEESFIVFYEDGGHEAFLAMSDYPEDDDASAKPSMVEVSIALIALVDPQIRGLIEEKIEDA